MQSIREKIKRRFSHKEENPNYDDYEDADEETTASLQKEIEGAEGDDKHPQGRPGSLLNRLISHGNKKTEDELAQDAAAYEKRQAATTSAATTTS